MKKALILLVFACILSAFSSYSRERQYTRIFDEAIKTLVLSVDGYDFTNPVLMLGSDEILHISFDDLSLDARTFSYRIDHFNADWTISDISEFEFLDGINNVDIIDSERSINTTVNFTHYTFSIPNHQLRPKISGNYLITVFESSRPDIPVLSARFHVVDPLVGIEARVRTNTDLGTQTGFQQVDFDVFTQRLGNIMNPASDIRVVVRQNGRTDNEVTNINPTFIAENRLTFSNNRALVFEAGNEYRSLDISNIYALDANVSSIRHIAPYFHVEMRGDTPRNTRGYVFTNDVNGRFRVNLQRSIHGSNVEADYLFVHFFLPTENPFFAGNVYLVGGFNQKLLNERSRMDFSYEMGGYIKSVLLKQGGYNYMFLFRQRGATAGSTAQIEGNFWQTENEYEIFIYHRPPGGRYDRLVGYKLLNSR